MKRTWEIKWGWHLLAGFWVVALSFSWSLLSMPEEFRRGIYPGVVEGYDRLNKKINNLGKEHTKEFEKIRSDYATREVSHAMLESVRRMALDHPPCR